MIRDRNRTQTRLLILASLFLGVFSLALTIAPSVRARAWILTPANLDHWLGYLAWLGCSWFLHASTKRFIPERDPYLLPVAALICGWGLLTIYRLTPQDASIGTSFGIRQTIWLALAVIVFAYGLRLPSDLGFLRRYKYLWLTGGLLLTGLTLIFGSNPLGVGPRLWLGCCGIYFQPSEPLKFLLVVYLAAYLADWTRVFHAEDWSFRRLNVLLPTLIMTGLALLLLVVQRDLGTASIFIFLYSVMVYLATGWRWLPVVSGAALAGSTLLGYALFDVVRLRIEAWLNPWLDPAGRSYQIVQSLIAVANGGILGRGPGMGSPTLVPVAQSDFVFAAIAEETGLVGALGLLLLIGLLVQRGLRAAIHAPDAFRRYLAAGLTAHLAAQSVLIIGGNLRLLPLTGVTLPFVSYGGSSLLVSLIELLILLHISAETAGQSLRFGQNTDVEKTVSRQMSSIFPLTALLFLSLFGVSFATGWWSYLRGPDLLTRTDNPRRSIADRFVRRGALLDRDSSPLAESIGSPGDYARTVYDPDLGSILGYTHPVYGQSGLEAALDAYLRGVVGNDPFTIWWHHLIYGQPPPGLDVRLTIDLALQTESDSLLQGQRGALILMNAQTGEILVMSSQPAFDANVLDDQWNDLIQDAGTPLLNRATQGSYPLGILGETLFGGPQYWRWLGVAPQIRLPLAYEPPGGGNVTPLQVVLAAAALSTGGDMPAPRLVLSFHAPDGAWTVLPPLGASTALLSQDQAEAITTDHQHPGDESIWQVSLAPEGENLTWYLAGTQPDGTSLPLALALVLEAQNLPLAEQIGQQLLSAAMGR